MLRVLKMILYGYLLASLLSCNRENTVTFSITVKDNQKNPMQGAEILIDGDILASSDHHGHINVSKAFPKNSRLKVEIRKTSADYYFAPYFDTIFVNNQETSEVNLAATLYFVPKPTHQDASEATASIDPEPVPSESPIAEPLASANTASPTIAIEETKPQVQGGDLSDQPSKVADRLPEEPITKIVTPPKIASIQYNLYAFHNDNPLKDVNITYGIMEGELLTKGCTTNARGRCSITFDSKPKLPVTFYAQKAGFKTESQKVRVDANGRTKFQLQSGQSIQIQAFVQHANYKKGMGGIEVYLQGKALGTTDDFGRFSTFYKGDHGDLIEVQLKSRVHLPNEFKTDFVVSGDMTLTKNFSEPEIPRVKVGVFETGISGDLNDGNTTKILRSMDKIIDESFKRTLFNQPIFAETPKSIIDSNAIALERTHNQLVESGWTNTILEHHLDSIIKPNLVRGQPNTLELSLINSKGTTLFAASERLKSLQDSASIEKVIASLSEKISSHYPFEGTIVAIAANEITTNFGKATIPSLNPNDQLRIYGSQADAFGRNHSTQLIGHATITSISQDSSTATISKIAPRAKAAIGDLVILSRQTPISVAKSSDPHSILIEVYSTQENVKQGISHANIYIDDVWVGTTNNDGSILIEKSRYKAGRSIRILKRGYADFTSDLTKSSKSSPSYELIKQFAFVSIDTNPSNATIMLDGIEVGKSPIKEPLKTTSGFVRLEIAPPPGYKKHLSILELDQGTLDLTGSRTIELEKDLLSPIEALVNRGQLDDAITSIKKIPKGHSDYLPGQALAGEIYLTMLNRPHLAAESFGNITSTPEVMSFIDKRYISAHVNEGLAIFLTGDSLRVTEPTTAIAHFQKSLEVFDRVIPHIRSLDAQDYHATLEKVHFYKALALHRIWDLSKESRLAPQVYAEWRKFFDSTEQLGNEKTSLTSQAEVFIKQAKSSLIPKTKKEMM